MKLLSVFVLLSGLGVLFGLTPGQADLLLLAVPCLVASLYLLLRGLWQGPPPAHDRPLSGRGPKVAQRWVIVDGSNVLHWKDGVVAIDIVREVVNLLQSHGFTPGVVFDANAGYKIADRYLHHHAMARQLGLPEDQVMVVPKGTQADTAVLAAARDHSAQVVSNDRFRDWAEDHPEVATPGHVIRGGYREGVLWLDLP